MKERRQGNEVQKDPMPHCEIFHLSVFRFRVQTVESPTYDAKYLIRSPMSNVRQSYDSS